MLQGDHGLEETVCQLRHEFGNYFIAVDEGIAGAMDMPKIKLELETQQFEDTKVKAEDHGNHGATSSAGRHANPFAANFSSKVEKLLRGFPYAVVGAEFSIVGERFDGVHYETGKDM
ncbi:unnamed protein product [Sphagnum jensenii]|uniref:Uncharacterized protein n=1 Tax=Sphagnum jensenii TaxID=128206 RepID=A0ABP1AF52_9BRYO